jgi:hypothetical protein
VLRFAGDPVASGVTASNAIGSSSLEGGAPGTSSTETTYPTDVACAGSKIAVLDAGNYRVLIWNSVPTATGEPADVVLGQGVFEVANPPTAGVFSATQFNTDDVDYSPGLFTDGTRLFLSDSLAHRVLGWSSIPTTHGASPNFVFGQGDFVSGGNSSPDLSKVAFGDPVGIASDGTRVAIVDSNYQRLLIWNSIADLKKVPARILGQTSLQRTEAHATSSVSFWLPSSAAFSPDGKIVVADTGNHRLMIWNSIPAADGAPADYQWGQPNFNASSRNKGNGSPAHSLGVYGPQSVSFCGDGKMLVADTSNNRVLVFNSVPTSDTTPPNLVLGQSNFNSNYANRGLGYAAGNSLSLPYTVQCDSKGRVIVADAGNSRVLIWSTAPVTNGQNADVVVGQAMMLSSGNGLTRSSFLSNATLFVHSDGTSLFVTDPAAHRILAWDTIPTTNGEPASKVLGQETFLTGEPNANGMPKGYWWPNAIYVHKGRKYVCETGNQRIVIDP